MGVGSSGGFACGGAIPNFATLIAHYEVTIIACHVALPAAAKAVTGGEEEQCMALALSLRMWPSVCGGWSD